MTGMQRFRVWEWVCAWWIDGHGGPGRWDEVCSCVNDAAAWTICELLMSKNVGILYTVSEAPPTSVPDPRVYGPSGRVVANSWEAILERGEVRHGNHSSG